MSSSKRNLTHVAAAPRPSVLDDVMGLSSPARPAADPTEPTIATEDPEPPARRGGEPPSRSEHEQRRDRERQRHIEPPAPDEPEPDPDPYVLYTVQIRRSTYIRIKQAEYFTPGFEQRKLVDKALNQELDENKYSDRQMPPEQQAKLLNSKKLKG